MTRTQLANNLLKLDMRLAIRVLRNDKLAAKMKTDQLLKELNIQTAKQ